MIIFFKEGQSILVLFSKKDKIKKNDIQEFGIEMIKKCVPKGILVLLLYNNYLNIIF